MTSPLATLFVDLAAAQGVESLALADSDEFWFRASDRFDVCARWVHDEQSVQLCTYVRVPAGSSLVEPFTDAQLDVEQSDWLVTHTQQDDWTHVIAWHPPSSYVAALCRGHAQTLDATRFPVFLQSFLDRVLALDEVFNPGNQDGDR